jgi:hypothetical protein
MVYLKDDFLRPKAEYPVYPPYHQGLYLEEYFHKRWNEDNINSDRKYIDIQIFKTILILTCKNI